MHHAAMLAECFPQAFGDPCLKKAQRVRRALGALRFSEGLSSKIDGGEMILPDSSAERTIRAATILACERIGGTAANVDNLLWQNQEIAGGLRFHLTETSRY